MNKVRGRRWRATALAGVSAVGLLAAAAVPANATGSWPGNQNAVAPPPISPDVACPPSLVTNPGFTDVTSTEFWHQSIYCIARYGFANGFNATTYGPTLEVTRADLALFVGRLAQKAGLAWNTTPYGFTDIATASAADQAAINALANAGVLSGKATTPATFAPSELVTRAQMAKFIDNTLIKTGAAPAGAAGTRDYFGDDDGSVFEPYINDLAADGVVQGVDSTHYDPYQNVYRDQMAGFLAQTLQLEVNAGKIANLYATSAPAVNTQPAGTLCTGTCDTGTLSSGSTAATADVQLQTTTAAYYTAYFGGASMNCDSQVTGSGKADQLYVEVTGTVTKTVTMTFPKSVVEELPNNGAPLMPVCFGSDYSFPGWSPQYSVYGNGSSSSPTEYEGLLLDCTDSAYTTSGYQIAPCVQSRSKLAGGAEQIVIFTPTNDLDYSGYW